MNLNFTNKGQAAIKNFNNEELLEIFGRYSNTLSKKYSIDVNVPSDINPDIIGKGELVVIIENVQCDVETFFKELGRDVKVPLKKRLTPTDKLDNVFKAEPIK